MRSLLLGASLCTALLLALLGPRSALALPALVPCEAAARAGRRGLCSSSAGSPKPLSLRGSNYIRLGGNPPYPAGHSTFDEGVYNRTRYNAAFAAMQRQGFNVLRVFIDARPGCGISGNATSTEPLDPHFLDRLAQVSDGACCCCAWPFSGASELLCRSSSPMRRPTGCTRSSRCKTPPTTSTSRPSPAACRSRLSGRGRAAKMCRS